MLKNLPFKSMILFAVILLCAANTLRAQGYLHRDNKKIVDGSGNEVILKGLNFGNFMIMEGYMMNSADVAGTQHEFKAKLKALIGDANTTTFYNTWLDSHVTKADLDSIKKWGFNSVRVPIHYEYFTNGATKGFQVLDSIVKWCRKDSIYAIIDLHAAPGGQGANASIDDYDSSKPSLWESQANKDLTVWLWKSIAMRYATEPFVGGYDLLNETNWNLPGNTDLRNLYIVITDSIRRYDKNHILYIEGNWYANDFTGLTPAWDNNMAYSFHKYWSNNDQAAIQFALSIRDGQNYPIWCGETGENSNYHFTKEMELFNQFGIGSAWWPMKKFESINCFASATNVQGYNDILSYWRTGSNMPDPATAYQSMLQLANNLKIQNCKIRKDVLYALTKQPGNLDTKPFKNVTIPGTIYATDFDYGTVNGSYWNKDVEDLHVSTNVSTTWNPGWVYRNDGVDIEKNAYASLNGYYVLGHADGEWLQYTVNVSQEGYYSAGILALAPAGGGLCHIEVNGQDVTGTISVNYNGSSMMSWTVLNSDNIYLKAGIDTVKFVFDKSNFWLGSITWSGPNAVTTIPGRLMSARTDGGGSLIYLNFNKKLTPALTLSASDFSLSKGSVVNISSVLQSQTDTSQIILQVSDQLLNTDKLTLSYSGKSIVFDVNDTLKPFTNAVVINTVLPMAMIPGQIEAENFTVNNGLSSESCSDIGGGLDMGYTDTGDYLEYLVYVSQSGTYSASFRVATTDATGAAKLSLMDNGTEQVLCNVSIPNTGGWQTWTTVTANVALQKGKHTLRYTVVTPRFNTNYFNFILLSTATKQVTGSNGEITVFPNPSGGIVYLDVPGTNQVTSVEVYDLSGKVLQRYNKPGTNSFDLSQLPKGICFLKIVTGEKTIVKKVVLE